MSLLGKRSLGTAVMVSKKVLFLVCALPFLAACLGARVGGRGGRYLAVISDYCQSVFWKFSAKQSRRGRIFNSPMIGRHRHQASVTYYENKDVSINFDKYKLIQYVFHSQVDKVRSKPFNMNISYPDDLVLMNSIQQLLLSKDYFHLNTSIWPEILWPNIYTSRFLRMIFVFPFEYTKPDQIEVEILHNFIQNCTVFFSNFTILFQNNLSHDSIFPPKLRVT